MKRRGGYAWGGPGTVELLHTKYFSPHIDEQSFLQLYESDTLSRIKADFDITDMWVTYSWGFSDAREEKHSEFLQKKLQNFQKLGIKTHLYVQGFNLVTEDFPEFQGWCKDINNKPLLYSKGRTFICPNHPDTQKILQKRVEQAAREDGNGVFVDNILFGYPPPFVRKDYLPFFGCNCLHCQKLYFKKYGEPLRFNRKCSPKSLQNYLDFRAESVTKMIASLSAITRKNKKEFGINLYDPLLHDSEWMYGYKLTDLLPHLDYLLIENHALNPEIGGNEYLKPLRKLTEKPIFVVSYNQGIGFDEAFTREQYTSLAQELESQNMSPCFKLTEFRTKNIWHAITFPLAKGDKITFQPRRFQAMPLQTTSHIAAIFFDITTRLLLWGIRQYFTSELFNASINALQIYSKNLHRPRKFTS